MSTLPFLLSVADELDNINSQSYMDDFGLGFHPHRQFYRTPTIQLSLPAGTDWMQQDTRHQPTSRHRSYRYCDESVNQNLEATDEHAEAVEDDTDIPPKQTDRNLLHRESDDTASSSASTRRARKLISAMNSNSNDRHGEPKAPAINTSISLYNVSKKCNKNHFRHLKAGNLATTSTASTSTAASTLTTSALSAATSAVPSISTPARTSTHPRASTPTSSTSSSYTLASTSTMSTPIQLTTTTSSRARTDTATTKSNTGITTDSTNSSIRVKDSRFSLGYRGHSKCLQGNNSSASSSSSSSSDESIQKVFSSIEFLTCFLLKKSRATKSTLSPASASTSLPTTSHNTSDGKKS